MVMADQAAVTGDGAHGRAGWNDLSVVAETLWPSARSALLLLDECGTAYTARATARPGERGGASRDNRGHWTVSWRSANALAQNRLVVEHTGRNEGDTKRPWPSSSPTSATQTSTARRQVTITDRGRAVASLLDRPTYRESERL